MDRFLLLALLVAACAPAREPPAVLRNPFRPVTVAELRDQPQKYLHEKVAFTANVERIEETTGGVWLHLEADGGELVLYAPLSFGGTLRDSMGSGAMEFEVEIGERRMTPLGHPAIEIMPYQIMKTRYFERPVPIE